MNTATPPPPDNTPQAAVKKGTGPPAYDSRDLLENGREALIRHGADAYRLLLTGSNKLILIK